jgi:hypothetical protein
MSTDYTKIQLISSASSNKVFAEGTGSFTISALGGAGETTTTATIPHGFSSDNLLFQVSTNGGPQSGTILPWQSNDGRVTLYAYIDSTNLYVTGISSDSGGLGAPAYPITYYYRVLVP